MIHIIDYDIIATGSKGNAVRIENIMIDCGISFARMRDALFKVDTLLITHSHSDHIKETTLNKIRQEFPDIKVYANADVAYQYDVDKVVGTLPVKLDADRTVIPFDGVHDVPVTGYVIQMKGLNILYMTDTAVVNPPGDLKFDYFFLESNFDLRKLKKLGRRYARRGYDPYLSVTRHLSTQKCKEFYFVNRRDENSVLIELHKSQRFY